MLIEAYSLHGISRATLAQFSFQALTSINLSSSTERDLGTVDSGLDVPRAARGQVHISAVARGWRWFCMLGPGIGVRL